ncbi:MULTISPECIES: polysaccharide deacetylase family protein [Microbacterium]|uniref:polysaccharide deacetylase family protein n=1 Tax=Microbacterium TaxID=33882 RepID=UPI0014858A39|nr:polysaccharide deacetylase family protein [Microbacterium sp. 4NA327F11]MCK9916484.1 polysaccharide deacetylase family protein [Microbacteriaceae bacterium K1510]
MASLPLRVRAHRHRYAVAALAAVTALLLSGCVAEGDAPAGPTGSAEVPTPTVVPTPLTAAERLLAAHPDPATCALTFAGDSVTAEPALATSGALYPTLPVPVAAGRVFAGWYATAAAASALDRTQRINGAQLATCDNRQRTLHAGWLSDAAATASRTTVSILMYHQFTTKPGGEHNPLRGNYTYIGDFEKQLAYLADGGFYLPTWDELSAFIDGTLWLPERSVIITDDDADKTWYELAVPVVTKYRLLTTSFAITRWTSPPSPSPWVILRSHTHDMHEAGANGKGKMVNLTEAQIAADMTASARIVGVAEVMAYPFGHYNATAEAGLRDAGFILARTTKAGRVRVGTPKLELPCVRIDYGMSMAAFARAVG